MVLVTLTAGWLLASCSGDGANSRTGEPEQEASTSTTVESEDVSVTGPVRRIVAPQLLEVGDGGGDPVLVLLLSDERPPPNPGETIEVTGPIRRIRLQALEVEFRVPLRGRGLESFEGMTCVVARSVVSIPPRDHETNSREGVVR